MREHERFAQQEPNKIHELKCWPEYFEEIWQFRKLAELRKNDRDFRIGDHIVLHEWNPATKDYMGRIVVGEITFITDFPEALREGYVALFFRVKSQHRLNSDLKVVAAYAS